MTTVQNVLDFMEDLAPAALKMDWDNVGLLCGNPDKEVRTVLVSLDPFPSVCREAVEVGADLLVTHHPLIFQPVSAVTEESVTGKALLTLIANNIAAINAHTNLDCADGGVNDTLAQKLGLQNIQKVPGDPEGLLRMGETVTQDLEAFLGNVKGCLHCAGLRYVDGQKPVKRVAVGGGSCGSEVETVLRAGCDTFVTADIKYNQFSTAQELGLNLIDAGHFSTENPVMNVVAEKIRAAFPEIRVILSKKHTDCVKFY